MGTGDTTRQRQAPARQRRCVRVKTVGYALRHIGDRSVLSKSPLVHLAYVERIAEQKYKGRLVSRGLALRDVLDSCVNDLVADLATDRGLSRVRQYLELSVQGLSCCKIAETMRLSREHVSRVYRKRALELLTEQFLLTTRGLSQNNEQDQGHHKNITTVSRNLPTIAQNATISSGEPEVVSR